MSLLDEGTKQESGTKPACWRMKEQLEACILESDCVRKYGKDPKDCAKLLSTNDSSVPYECRVLQSSFLKCRQSILDPRSRFRGLKVGTTEFESLIHVVDCETFYKSLLDKGFTRLMIQIGRGTYVPLQNNAATIPSDAAVDNWKHVWPASANEKQRRLHIEVCRYRASLGDDLRVADLVVSHCGAGTCMETLEGRHALLVVVINETLMHNHQVELADQLAADRYCVATRCADLLTLLGSDIDFVERRVGTTQLVEFTPGQPARFSRFLDALTIRN